MEPSAYRLDACVEPMLKLSEAIEQPQIKARGLVTEVLRAGSDPQQQIVCPLKFSGGLSAPRHIGAALGAHTAEVLSELGYSVEQIAQFKAAKVVA